MMLHRHFEAERVPKAPDEPKRPAVEAEPAVKEPVEPKRKRKASTAK